MTFQRDIANPPRPDCMPPGDWALFLDLDGTLIDLAPTPDSVSVPTDLIETLAVLQAQLSGALAIVSGRSLDVIDSLLAPLKLAAAAEHGAELRPENEVSPQDDSHMTVPASWRAHLRDLATHWPGALVEEKPHGVAIHYRANPALEAEIGGAMESMAAQHPDFEVLPAIMAREIRHRDANKGAALRRLMEMAPFSARRPLFIGDDVTDEEAVRAANDLGGVGLRVPQHFGGEPERVRAWLSEFAHHLQPGGKP